MKRHNSDAFTVSAHNVVVEPETKAQQQCWESEVIKSNKQQIKNTNIPHSEVYFKSVTD